jgi:hypothetical protein
MTSLHRLAAVHKQNEVSWHCEVSNKAHRTLRQALSKQLHHKSDTLISTGNTSLNKLQRIDPVKYCYRITVCRKQGKQQDVVCFRTGVKRHFVTASFYNITPAQASMTSPSAMHNKFQILYSLHDHIYGMPLSQ